MKHLTTLSLIFFALIATNSFAQNQLKRYDLESGEIIYETTTSGKMMGSTISGSGTEKLYFKNWGGDLEIRDTKSSETTSIKFFWKRKNRNRKYA